MCLWILSMLCCSFCHSCFFGMTISWHKVYCDSHKPRTFSKSSLICTPFMPGVMNVCPHNRYSTTIFKWEGVEGIWMSIWDKLLCSLWEVICRTCVLPWKSFTSPPSIIVRNLQSFATYILSLSLLLSLWFSTSCCHAFFFLQSDKTEKEVVSWKGCWTPSLDEGTFLSDSHCPSIVLLLHSKRTLIFFPQDKTRLLESSWGRGYNDERRWQLKGRLLFLISFRDFEVKFWEIESVIV